jgi:uncharacterized protein YcbK (DUF882 family)
VAVGNARLKTTRFFLARAGYSCGLAFLIFLFGSKALQNAVAEGETRTITLHHIHTDENITITYKRDGLYVESALDKLNWFLRDWRRGEATHMDPHLIDLVWEVQREAGSKTPVEVVCGYRSPQTNAMLRRRSRGVARFSQHMLGHAMDFYVPGVPLEEIRVIGLRLERGGVGFYPTSGSPFVHMDTGGVRMWPRMTREQLLHVFPDGRTAYLPTDGRPLPGYALALADIKKRGQDPSESWLEEAHNTGFNVNQVMASNERSHTNPATGSFGPRKQERQGDDDGSATLAAAAPAPAPVAAATQAQPPNALLAALERAAERERQAVRASAAQQPRYQTASFVAPAAQPGDASSQAPGLTPNQIIAARGYWGGSPGGESTLPAAKPLNAAARPHREVVASADITGGLSPWPAAASQDRVPPDLALAYAAQPEREAPSPSSSALPASATTTLAAAYQARLQPPPAATTIAVKRAADQPASTIVAARPRLSSAAAAPPASQFDNPWLSAVMVSPSVSRYLTTLTLGDQDYRTLAPLVQKPDRSVMMTFSADPSPGLTQDHFSGSAIVFVPTVTYQTYTASLH